MIYHASTWPLVIPPYTDELLGFLDCDYATTPLSTDVELSQAIAASGHGHPGSSTYAHRVLQAHRLRRFEAETGHPF